MNWYQGAILPPILIGLLHNVHLFTIWHNLQMVTAVNKNVRKVTNEHEELSRLEHKKRQITTQHIECQRVVCIFNNQIKSRSCP